MKSKSPSYIHTADEHPTEPWVTLKEHTKQVKWLQSRLTDMQRWEMTPPCQAHSPRVCTSYSDMKKDWLPIAQAARRKYPNLDRYTAVNIYLSSFNRAIYTLKIYRRVVITLIFFNAIVLFFTLT